MTAHPDPLPDLSGRHPRDIVRWAWETYGPRVMTTTAFGYSGMALLHMMRGVAPEIPVYFIDTGFHFPETLQFRDYCVRELGYRIIDLRPEVPHEVFVAQHGADFMTRSRENADHCCAVNKVAPLQKLLAEGRYDAWIAALRRDQAPTRAATPILQLQPNGMLKVCPLAEWTKQDVWRYIREHRVPTHPLHDEGYMSIGCAPCTRRIGEGEDERAGRWSGTGKIECGLHVPPPRSPAD